MISIADHIPVLIIVIPLLSALVTLAAGWIDKRTPFCITVTTVSAQFVASLILLYRVHTQGPLRWLGGWQPPWGIEYVIDGLNAYVLVVVLLMASSVLSTPRGTLSTNCHRNGSHSTRSYNF